MKRPVVMGPVTLNREPFAVTICSYLLLAFVTCFIATLPTIISILSVPFAVFVYIWFELFGHFLHPVRFYRNRSLAPPNSMAIRRPSSISKPVTPKTLNRSFAVSPKNIPINRMNIEKSLSPLYLFTSRPPSKTSKVLSPKLPPREEQPVEEILQNPTIAEGEAAEIAQEVNEEANHVVEKVFNNPQEQIQPEEEDKRLVSGSDDVTQLPSDDDNDDRHSDRGPSSPREDSDRDQKNVSINIQVQAKQID